MTTIDSGRMSMFASVRSELATNSADPADRRAVLEDRVADLAGIVSARRQVIDVAAQVREDPLDVEEPVIRVT